MSINKKVILTELGIVIVAQNHNPTILNPDFLKRNKIVPENWELACPPICLPPVARVSFTKGVNIFSQPERIIFDAPVKSQAARWRVGAVLSGVGPPVHLADR